MDVRIEVNGKVLFFGRGGTYDHILDVTGEDPIAWSQNLVKKIDEKGNVVAMMKEVAIMAYSGVNLALDIEQKPNVPFTEVKQWTRTLSFDQWAVIVNSFFDSILEKQETPGEAKTQEAASLPG